jgi:hypothetical protein
MCSNDFITQNVYVFLAVSASLRWLNNVSGVLLVQVSLLLIGQQVLGDFFSYRPFLKEKNFAEYVFTIPFSPHANQLVHWIIWILYTIL